MLDCEEKSLIKSAKRLPRRIETARRSPGKEHFQLPPITWRMEGGDRRQGSANVGQVVQHEPSRRSVEFSYVILPALLDMASPKFQWPSTVMIFAPTPMKAVYEDAGSLINASHMPMLTLTLDVTREQFSDILRLHESGGLQTFHFTVKAQRGDAPHSWPIQGWGMSVNFEGR